MDQRVHQFVVDWTVSSPYIAVLSPSMLNWDRSAWQAQIRLSTQQGFNKSLFLSLVEGRSPNSFNTTIRCTRSPIHTSPSTPH